MRQAMITYDDLVDHLIILFDEDPLDSRAIAAAKRAVAEAYRDLAQSHAWSSYITRGMFVSNPAYSTGSVAYTESTQTVTLTGGTFPSYADKCHINFKLSSLHHSAFPVSRRLSDTQLLLKPGSTPGYDIAAGTSYTLFQRGYDLPEDFREMGRLIDLQNQYVLSMQDPDRDEMMGVFIYSAPDTSWQFSIRGSEHTPGRRAVYLTPPPRAQRTYQYVYIRAPKRLRNARVTGGTVDVNAGSPTVTGDSTSFDQTMVGSILRIGTQTETPTGPLGSLRDATAPYVEEHVIRSVSSATSLELETTVAASGTKLLYTISDMIDIAEGPMLTALQRMSEAAYAVLTKRYIEQRTQRQADAARALSLAMEYDLTSVRPHGAGYYDPFDDVPITTDPG